MKSSATANWKGSGKEGIGKLHTRSGVIKNKPDSQLSKPEKKLQAWIIKSALQAQM